MITKTNSYLIYSPISYQSKPYKQLTSTSSTEKNHNKNQTQKQKKPLLFKRENHKNWTKKQTKKKSLSKKLQNKITWNKMANKSQVTSKKSVEKHVIAKLDALQNCAFVLKNRGSVSIVTVLTAAMKTLIIKKTGRILTTPTNYRLNKAVHSKHYQCS